MEGGRIFEIVMEIMFWFSIAGVIYMLLLKITGHSPTDAQILYGIVGSTFVYLVAFSFKAGKFAGRVGEFMINTKEFMNDTKTFMNENRESLHKIQHEIIEVKSDIRYMKKLT